MADAEFIAFCYAAWSGHGASREFMQRWARQCPTAAFKGDPTEYATRRLPNGDKAVYRRVPVALTNLDEGGDRYIPGIAPDAPPGHLKFTNGRTGAATLPANEIDVNDCARSHGMNPTQGRRASAEQDGTIS